jgi:hypothetical protein
MASELRIAVSRSTWKGAEQLKVGSQCVSVEDLAAEDTRKRWQRDRPDLMASAVALAAVVFAVGFEVALAVVVVAVIVVDSVAATKIAASVEVGVASAGPEVAIVDSRMVFHPAQAAVLVREAMAAGAAMADATVAETSLAAEAEAAEAAAVGMAGVEVVAAVMEAVMAAAAAVVVVAARTTTDLVVAVAATAIAMLVALGAIWSQFGREKMEAITAVVVGTTTDHATTTLENEATTVGMRTLGSCAATDEHLIWLVGIRYLS